MIDSLLSAMLTQNAVTTMAIIIPLLLQLGGVLLVVFVDPYIIKKHKFVMLAIVILVFSLIAQNFIENKFSANEAMWLSRRYLAIYGYCVRPVIIVLFFYIVEPSRRYIVAWVMIALNAAIHLTALFSDICFYIDENNHYRGGPLGNTCMFVSLGLLAYLLFLVIRKYAGKSKKGLFIPVLNVAVIVAATIMDGSVGYSSQPVTFLSEAIVSSCVFFYIWLHLQFVHEHEEDLVAQQRIKIMMSQIQPHFMYNTLSTIQALCIKDPQKASEVTEKFGTYLRQNLDSLNQTTPVPIQKEIEFTKTYSDIENVRFPNITVQYEIEDKDFCLPVLTVQPLVENAIRHGVRGRKDGKIIVRTRKDGNIHEVNVIDNGKGFDVGKIEEYDSSHIGIRNVRERIEKMCDGSLEIVSKEGEGTAVMIRVPC